MLKNGKAAILIVNDDHQVLELIEAILVNTGFSVRTAASVSGAMKALSETGPPDLIITDIHMPDIDGWSFCRLLRMPEYHEFNEVPVLMVSATFLTDEIRRISLENGAGDHLAAPFSAGELIDKVNGLITGKPGPEPIDILIVDPDEARRDGLARTFGKRGFQAQCRESLSGEEYTHKNAPSVLIYNPVADGTESLRKIRRIRASRPEAVIIVAAGRGFMVPPASFLYAGAAAVRHEDVSPDDLADTAILAGRQSAFLQAGALLKEKISRLKESEERYRFLVENITGAIVRLDTDRRISYASPVIERFTGYSPRELVGQRIRSFVPEEDIPSITEAYERAMAGENRPFEFRTIDRNGGIHYVRGSAQPIFTDGAFAGSTVLLGDITAEKKARESLAWERHMFTMLMDTVPDYIYFKDLDGRFLKVNRAKAARHGFGDPEMMIGKSDYDFFAGEHADKARSDEMHIVETRTPIVDIEEKLIWPDGRVSWTSTTKLPLYDLDGNVMGTFGISRSITERKKLEEVVLTERKRLADIIDAMPNPVFFKNAEGRYEECNQAFLDFTGRTRDAVLGLTADEVFPMQPIDEFNRNDLEVIRSKACRIFESMVPHSDGSTRAVMFNLSPLLAKNDTVRGLIGVMQDITGHRHYENAIETRLRYEQAVGAFSKELLDASAGGEAIAPALGHLLGATGAGRVYMFENFEDPDDGLCMRQTHEVCAPGVTPQMDNPELQHLPYQKGFTRWLRKLPDGMPVIGTIEDFPASERTILESQGILSLLVIPVFVSGKWFGFIGFDDTESRREWDANDIFILNTAAEMMGSFLGRIRAENEIRSLLNEKELLLREVHHRIKNNMITISSLLSLQARGMEEDRTTEALTEAQGRIRGMMMIYDRLYRSKDFRRVSAAGYLGDLIRDIVAVSGESTRITIEEKIEEREMDSKILFPLGIIVNELLSNAYKYAFPDGRRGTISISLRQLDDGTMELVFRDDGVGMREPSGPGESKGFGLNLVAMLTRQIKGQMENTGIDGMRYRIVFKTNRA